MEIILVVALAGALVWWGYTQLNRKETKGRHPLDAVTNKEAPYKIETPVVDNKTGEPVVNPQITDAVTRAQPAWHTAPEEGSKLADNPLDVNKDGKVNLEDVKEAVKKARGRVKKAADVDGDGKVTAKDAKVVAKKVKEKATKKVAAMKPKAKAKAKTTKSKKKA